jgi:hypothetical protein
MSGAKFVKGKRGEKENEAIHVKGSQRCIGSHSKRDGRASDICQHVVVDVEDFKSAVCLQV